MRCDWLSLSTKCMFLASPKGQRLCHGLDASDIISRAVGWGPCIFVSVQCCSLGLCTDTRLAQIVTLQMLFEIQAAPQPSSFAVLRSLAATPSCVSSLQLLVVLQPIIESARSATVCVPWAMLSRQSVAGKQAHLRSSALRLCTAWHWLFALRLALRNFNANDKIQT